MKSIPAMILLIVSCLVLIASIVFCVCSIIDINRILNELANDPSASGMDYFGIGMGHGIILFSTSALGLILSGISKKLQQTKALQNVSLAAIIIFSLLAIAAIFLFYR